VSKPIYTCKWTWVSEWLCVLSVFVCEWQRTHLLICVYEWERELTSLPPFRPITRRTNERTDGHTRFSAETLNPKPRHTQEDTHYTEWYPHPEWFFLSLTVLRTHPRVHPLHWGTLFSSQTNRTLSDTHDNEGYPWHWVIPMTLRDTPNTKWYPLPWVSSQ
jgi:hypothetical protein